VSAFLQRDVAGFLAALMLKFGWSVLLAGGWAGGGIDRGYVNVAVWLAFAVAVFVVMWKVGQGEPPGARGQR
jgi:hypothetical protein